MEQREIPGGRGQVYELHVADIAPQVKEEHMPPIASYRLPCAVQLHGVPQRGGLLEVGGQGLVEADGLIYESKGRPGRGDAGGVAGAATDEEKLRKIYATVMSLENTSYTREREKREEKAAGVKVNNTSDVLKSKRGNSTALTELFVGMARAAGDEGVCDAGTGPVTGVLYADLAELSGSSMTR